jgi:hypothetical protein
VEGVLEEQKRALARLWPRQMGSNVVRVRVEEYELQEWQMKRLAVAVAACERTEARRTLQDLRLGIRTRLGADLGFLDSVWYSAN